MLLLIAEFAYNNTKNASTGHISFKLNCKYYPRVFFEDKTNLCLKSCFANEIVEELKELIDIYYQNLFYVQKLQKKVDNKGIKSYSYAQDKKV